MIHFITQLIGVSYMRLATLFLLFMAQSVWAQLPVYVSILPQKYFVERIGGQHVDVSVMVQAGHSPATYEPTPQQMAKLSNTQLYIRIGVPFEEVWLHKLQQNNPQLNVVDARQGIELLAMPDIKTLLSETHNHDKNEDEHEHEGHHDEDEHEHEGHHDEDEHEHEGHHDEDKHHGHHHGAFDPHIWLSPRLVKIMGQQILQQLIQYDPEHKIDYQQNYARFEQDLTALDQQIQQTLSNVKHTKFMVFHPSWGYFAHTYDLQQIPIEVEGKSPTAKQLAQLIGYAKQQQVKTVFVQKQFSQKAAHTIAKTIRAQLIVVDPLAEDYINNLREVANTFAQAMK